MTFIEWLREVKGYRVMDDYDITEQLSAGEADVLWQQYDSGSEYDEEGLS